MFGFIKNLFSGIAAFFGSFLGAKKSQEQLSSAPKAKKKGGYFMELDEAESTPPATNNQPPKAQPPAEQKKPEPAKAPASASNGAKPAQAPEAPANPEPVRFELVQTAEAVTAIPTKAPEESKNGKIPSSNDSTFAPKYLNPVSSSTGRRRPGPSMNPFMDMARDVKKS